MQYSSYRIDMVIMYLFTDEFKWTPCLPASTNKQLYRIFKKFSVALRQASKGKRGRAGGHEEV